MAAPMENNIEDDICKRFNIPSLRPNQKKAVKGVMDRKDVFVGTKTGSGKSLTYECIPVLFPDVCVVIITPLIFIMSEQCKKLTALGFKASYIGKDSSENSDLINGEYDFIFASPEQLVGDLKWCDVLKSDVYQRKLRAIVVDEAHTVIQCGESQDRKTEPNGFQESENFVHCVQTLKWWHLQQQRGQPTEEKS
ncbi:uncharacterized protein LOC134266202 [Saccostrea cucullata]|uniref:uncharacterized protein LOC134266202 n=1 Tax=Saccostrea cuccullata TaxID=36930 RepID=UPI002ED1315D